MSLGAPLPRENRTYSEAVIRRCKSLIHLQIWAGILPQKLDQWLTHFRTEQDRFLAAKLLDSLVYRSPQQTEALISQLAQRAIPDLSRQPGFLHGPLDGWEIRMQSHTDPKIRIAPVVVLGDPASKSGPTVSRKMKRHLRLEDKWILDASTIKFTPHNTVLIFVDDFLGTGFQFKKFYKKQKLASLDPSIQLIYAPLIAHRRGIHRIESTCARVRITYAELMDESYNVFGTFVKGTPSEPSGQQLYAIYLDFLKRIGMTSVARRHLGYSRLGLSLAFEHGTPNASLPILWQDTDTYTPLFKR